MLTKPLNHQLYLLILTHTVAVFMDYHCLTHQCAVMDQAWSFLAMVPHHMHQHHRPGDLIEGIQISGESVHLPVAGCRDDGAWSAKPIFLSISSFIALNCR